ncbi:hypothetical protein PR202_gb26818 [Eleusine coracana subsp. coracana]|uniref:Fungal lipase-type domain-containing protein n=1 Tax=Eleusine coracana subsp. coracana TaxID=191504 RepID=A0AAV5FS42_ELECO|nr:hypothetical protein PR202_gb26818 [Eleusine coracana subsp. coracana]
MDALRFMRGGAAPPQPPVASASVPPPPTAQQRRQPPRAPLLRLWPRGGGGEKTAAAGSAVRGAEARSPPEEAPVVEGGERGQGSWVLQILRVQPRWEEAAHAEATGGGGGDQEPEPEPEREREAAGGGGGDVEECASCGGEEGCAVGYDDEDEVFDRASFSRLLKKVPLADVKEYSKMSYLCNIAYMIPQIQPKCLRRYNLRFVTSSVQEKAKAASDEKQENGSGKTESPEQESEAVENVAKASEERGPGLRINPFVAYRVVSSAASYLHSRAVGIMPFGSRNDVDNDPTIITFVDGENGEGLTMDEASLNSVTSMVAAKEETRQAVADDLNSSRSCPCEWFVCDDDQTRTRHFVVQGSESIASWQANLLFEPVKFEELDVMVHRGIYEAAKGMYHQMLPYVKSHLRERGESASLRFTGHSLGGSLALLVNLMLLVRGDSPASSLLPVITFGAPCIMCGGDQLLRRLGLPRSHVQSVTMHRDIVPRVFSCHYPDHVANILKLANGNFRSHPCLANQALARFLSVLKLLYAPMGEVLILQPDQRFSPHHHLLPPDSGMYHLGEAGASLSQVRSAVSAFFNSPHPLEILKDGGAYGPRGAVYRDHDVNSYLRSVRGVARKEARRARDAERDRWRWRLLFLWWPSLGLSSGIVGAVVEARRRAHLLLVVLLPANLIALGAFLVVRFR